MDLVQNFQENKCFVISVGGRFFLYFVSDRLSCSLFAFRFWLEFWKKNSFQLVFDFFRIFFHFLKSWNSACGRLLVCGSGSLALSDSHSSLRRSFFNIFFALIPMFFHFCSLENSVGRILILNLVWERVFRSILTAFRFWLEFRKSIFYIFPSSLRLFYL